MRSAREPASESVERVWEVGLVCLRRLGRGGRLGFSRLDEDEEW